MANPNNKAHSLTIYAYDDAGGPAEHVRRSAHAYDYFTCILNPYTRKVGLGIKRL